MKDMSDPVILFVKPKAISADDKASLKEAGVVVIEVANPHEVKLIRASSELSGGELLQAAAKAISEITDNDYGKQVQQKFSRAVCAAIAASKQ